MEGGGRGRGEVHGGGDLPVRIPKSVSAAVFSLAQWWWIECLVHCGFEGGQGRGPGGWGGWGGFTVTAVRQQRDAVVVKLCRDATPTSGVREAGIHLVQVTLFSASSTPAAALISTC